MQRPNFSEKVLVCIRRDMHCPWQPSGTSSCSRSTPLTVTTGPWCVYCKKKMAKKMVWKTKWGFRFLSPELLPHSVTLKGPREQFILNFNIYFETRFLIHTLNIFIHNLKPNNYHRHIWLIYDSYIIWAMLLQKRISSIKERFLLMAAARGSRD